MVQEIRKDLIGDRSPDMEKMLPYWTLVDALNDGIDAMRAGGKKWLEPFPHEDDEDYKFRLSQTKMTNVFSDILESLSSKPYEKAITLEGENHPEFLTEFVQDVDGAGSDLSMFSTDVFEAGIRSAVDWIFVDYPNVDTKRVITVDEKKRNNMRAYWTRVIAINVLEVKTKMFGGDERLTYFRFLEPGEVDHVREIYIDDNGAILWNLYVKTDKYDDKAQTFYTIESSGVMTIDEIPIVPFVTGRRIGRTFVLKPPMKAAADAQRDLYHQESALKYAKVLAAFPMLSASGVKPERDSANNIIPIGIGPNKVLYAPPTPDGQIGSWKYVEPNANTLQFLAKDIETGIQNLRELGRQPLTAQSENLTVVTTAFAAGKAKSSVAAWAGRLKHALIRALEITCKWERVEPGEIKLFVFTDFDQFTDSEDIDALSAARERGDISQETFWEEAKRRGLLSDTFDPKREKKRLLLEVPGDSGEITEDD